MKLVSLVCALTFVMIAWTVDVVLKKTPKMTSSSRMAKKGAEFLEYYFLIWSIRIKTGKLHLQTKVQKALGKWILLLQLLLMMVTLVP